MKHFSSLILNKLCWLALLWGWLGLVARPAHATAADLGGAPASTPSLAEALNPDGTLRAGAQGSFDARHFTMRTAPDGRPAFSPTRVAGTGDENWQDNFRLPGTNGQVNALVQIGTTVYIGGSFTRAGNVAANGIAKWDGTTWSTLGTGTKNGVGTYIYATPGIVNALAAVGNDLYVGGFFWLAGGVPAKGVAKWNGTTWSALGTGIATGADAQAYVGKISTLAAAGTSVYVGGEFAYAGGTKATNIAKWDGTTWSSLGTSASEGTNRPVYAIAAAGTSVYVGGEFTQAGGVAVSNVAKWDGATWSALGTGTSGGVTAIAVLGTSVYVAGGFKKAGSVMANNVAKWDGTTWSALGTGTTNGVDNVASALFVAGTSLYIGGFFGTAGGVDANSIAKWDGTNWSSLGTGDNNGVSTHSFFTNVQAITAVGTSLYLGGSFTTAGSAVAKYVTRWDGTAWNILGDKANGADGAVYAVAVAGTDVYVGGRFTSVGPVRASHVAKWNGTRWSALSVTDQYGYTYNGVEGDGVVYALAVTGSTLYVGGIFASAGTVTASNVAKWDGTRWSSLGTGTTNGVAAAANSTAPTYVYALAVSGTSLYVGGAFGKAGGATANNVAKWSGTAWSSLGTGTANGVASTVYALAVLGTDLYAGGDFKQAGGAAASYIARWNGTSWNTLGAGTTNGVSAGVRALAAAGTALYVGGGFSQAGGATVNNVAKWDGTAWSSLGTGTAIGTNGTVLALAVAGSNVYVGGSLTTAGGATANYVAKWNGVSWSALGTGLSDAVRALGAGTGTKVNVGGDFLSLKDESKVSFYFGVYDDASTPLATLAPAGQSASPALTIYPNPTHASFTANVPGVAGATTVQVELLNTLGQVVRRQAAPLPTAGAALHFETAGLAKGVYLLRTQAGSATLTERVVVQ